MRFGLSGATMGLLMPLCILVTIPNHPLIITPTFLLLPTKPLMKLVKSSAPAALDKSSTNPPPHHHSLLLLAIIFDPVPVMPPILLVSQNKNKLLELFQLPRLLCVLSLPEPSEPMPEVYWNTTDLARRL